MLWVPPGPFRGAAWFWDAPLLGCHFCEALGISWGSCQYMLSSSWSPFLKPVSHHPHWEELLPEISSLSRLSVRLKPFPLVPSSQALLLPARNEGRSQHLRQPERSAPASARATRTPSPKQPPWASHLSSSWELLKHPKNTITTHLLPCSCVRRHHRHQDTKTGTTRGAAIASSSASLCSVGQLLCPGASGDRFCGVPWPGTPEHRVFQNQPALWSPCPHGHCDA